MKDETAWDYSHCNIGHPCEHCDDICTFRLVKDADKKENENERITTKLEGTEQ